jgi:putative spermidine/putrescine transport system substrate-binding protein
MIRSTRAAAVATAALLTVAVSGCADTGSDPATASKKLVVSTFGFGADVFEKNVVGPFEKQTGIKVVVESGANADRLTKLRINRNNPTVDVMLISDLYATLGEQQGLFEKIDKDKVPNLSRIYDFAKSDNGYGPAYTYQLLGMLYRTDKVKKTPTLADLWNPAYKGKIAVPDMSTSAGAPLLASTAETFGSGPKDIDTAFGKLGDLSPNVLKFFSRSTEVVSLLERGEAVMAPTLDLFAVDPVKAGQKLAWAPFDKGRYLVNNTVQVVKGTQNKSGAEKFINYLLSADVQTKSAASVDDKPVNKEAKLPDAISKVSGEAAKDPSAAGFTSPDLTFEAKNNDDWVDRFQREVSG